MKYQGSCHCKALTFSVMGDLTHVIECNCSICTRKGALHWRVPPEAVSITPSDIEMGSYSFGTFKVRHRFCPKCGIHLFVEGAGRPDSPVTVVNVRCLEGVDLSRLPVAHFDGRSL